MSVVNLKSQSANLHPVEQENETQQAVFKDNIEHLEALEYLARLRLARACIRDARKQGAFPESGEISSDQMFEDLMKPPEGFIENGFSKPDLRSDQIVGQIKLLEEEINQKAEYSLERGIDLYFEQFSRSYNLDPFERLVLALLVANNTGNAFRSLYEKSGLDPENRQDGSMSVGAILSLIHPDYRSQITNRKYFSINSTLVRKEILIFRDYFDEGTNILDVSVRLHERIVRYLIGDNHIYDMDFQWISRDRSRVQMDQVVLADGIKEDVLRMAESFSRNRSNKSKAALDEFYGYGTGLVYLFHGPSGTGKTMLAHALATRLNKELLTANMELASQHMASSEDLIKYLFREAKLTDGIVFFDECDESFHDRTRDSRTLLIELEKSECITILATHRVIEMDPSLDRRISMKIPFSFPDKPRRESIWKALVPSQVKIGKDVNFDVLAEKYVFTGGLIKNTLFMAITNAMSRNGNSEISLSQRDIETAADWQSASMFDLNGFGLTYIPEGNVQGLSLTTSDRQRFEKMVGAIKDLDISRSGLRILLGCTDIETGVGLVDALAAGCDMKVRKFDFPDLFGKGDRSMKLIDPMTHREMETLEYALKTSTGKKSLTLIVDQENWLEKLFVNEEKDSGTLKDTLGFYREVRRFDGILFFVTAPMKIRSLPVEFSHYFEVHPPSEELQIRKWENYLGEDEKTQTRIMDMVEQYSLHINEIDQIHEMAKTTAVLEGLETPTLEHVNDALHRFKGRQMVPVLFGGVGI